MRGFILFLCTSWVFAATATEFTLTASTAAPQKTLRYDDESDHEYSYLNALLKNANFYNLDTKQSAGALLVVQKAYLTSGDLNRMASDIAEALEEVPQFVGRPFITNKRIVVYMYPYSDTSPVSAVAQMGFEDLEWGVRLEHAKEDQSPTFHEFTHLTQNFNGQNSMSLNEGFADYVQQHMRPNKPYDFYPATPVSTLAKGALAQYTDQGFLDRVGANDFSKLFSDLNEKHAFYFVSCSFVTYLIQNEGGLAKFIQLRDAGGMDHDYQTDYSASLETLRQAWLKSLQ